MIGSEEALQFLNNHRGDAVVVTGFSSTVLWGNVSNRQELDLRGGLGLAMSKASSIGLGLALARPDQKVIILDGDGSLLMNLGSLVTIADAGPKNLVHFVFQDGAYITTGGQPVPGAGMVDFEEIARGAGIRHCYTFDDVEDFASNVERLLQEEGPVFICLKVTTPPFPRPFSYPGGLTVPDELRKVKGALEALPG